MYQISKQDYENNLRQKFSTDNFSVLTFSAATKPVTIKCRL